VVPRLKTGGSSDFACRAHKKDGRPRSRPPVPLCVALTVQNDSRLRRFRGPSRPLVNAGGVCRSGGRCLLPRTACSGDQIDRPPQHILRFLHQGSEPPCARYAPRSRRAAAAPSHAGPLPGGGFLRLRGPPLWDRATPWRGRSSSSCQLILRTLWRSSSCPILNAPPVRWSNAQKGSTP
jgi:hypothetical protein